AAEPYRDEARERAAASRVEQLGEGDRRAVDRREERDLPAQQEHAPASEEVGRARELAAEAYPRRHRIGAAPVVAEAEVRLDERAGAKARGLELVARLVGVEHE